MKRSSMTLLVGRRLIGPVIAALLLMALVATLLPARADAGVRIRAQLKTPHLQAFVDTGPRGLRVPVRAGIHVSRLTKQDQQIAQRLANRTPYRKVVFLDLRRAGYSWREIGRILRIPSRVLSQAVWPALHRSHSIRYNNDGRGCGWNDR